MSDTDTDAPNAAGRPGLVRLVWVAVAATLLGVGGWAWVLLGDGGPPRSALLPASPGELLDRPCIERSGREMTTHDLKGDYLLASFMFTSCSGTCPPLMNALREVQDATKGMDDLRLVSFTTDPKNDTPDVLAEYADQVGADPDRWYFIFSAVGAVQQIAHEGMKVGHNSEPIYHSNRFVLLDKAGRVRSYYSPLAADGEPDWLEVLVRDLKTLRGADPILPTLNAGLNLTATVLLVLGVRAIRAGREETHKRLMLSALGVSAAFLVSYLTHHALHGSTPFRGEGAIRTFYFALLFSHTVLAALVPILALRTAWLGLKDRRAQHRRWARWTFPIWLYVSVTGVVIYLMLYQL